MFEFRPTRYTRKEQKSLGCSLVVTAKPPQYAWKTFQMLTGKRFKLGNPTMALDIVDGKRVAITIPAGETIKVASGPTGEGDRLVDVVWDGRTVAMFAFDVNVRGTEIKDSHSEVQSAAQAPQGKQVSQ